MTVAPVGASGSPLATVADLAAYLQQDPSTVDETQADFYLRLASAAVRGYLRTSVAPPVSETVLLDPCDGLPAVVLPEWPVRSVDLVEISYPDGTWRDVTSFVWVSVASSIITAHSAEVFWPLGPATWRITYTHGWDTAPDDVATITAQIAGEAYASSAGVQSESIGGYSVRYEKGGIQLNALQQSALANYRNPVVA